MSGDEPIADECANVATMPTRASQDKSLVDNVDPNDVLIDRDQSFIVRASDPKSSFTIYTEPMRVQWARISKEGNLGVSFEYNDKKINPAEDSRAKAAFEMSLSVGNDVDEVTAAMPSIVPKQMKTMTAVYESAVAMLKYAFLHPDVKKGLDAHVQAAYVQAYDAERKRDEDNAVEFGHEQKYASIDDVVEAADKDPVLKARLAAAQLKIFLAAAKKPPNPALFDEEGVQKRTIATPAKAKLKKIKIDISRKVYHYTGKYDPDSMPPMPVFKPGFVLTPENWPALRAQLANVHPDEIDPETGALVLKKMYVYNPWTFVDGKGALIPIPPLANSNVNPFFDPLERRVALVQVRLMFRLWVSTDGYGISITPSKEIRIVRRSKQLASTDDVPIDEALAQSWDEDVGDDVPAVNAMPGENKRKLLEAPPVQPPLEFAADKATLLSMVD
jgi:hypothetical protein